MTARNILHVTYDMNIGGTEQVIRNLIEGLNANKFRSSILCIDGTVGPWGQQLQQKGVSVFCLERRPGFDLRLIRNIRKLIKAEHFDLVHTHQYTPYVYGLFGAMTTGRPVIFTEHGRFYPDLSSFKRRLINPWLEKCTAAITAISTATAQALTIHENFSAGNISVIYNGITDRSIQPAEALRQELGLLADDIVLGTISRLDSIKNHPLLIRAFARCRERNSTLRLLVVGDGPMREELHNQTMSLGLKDAVIFTGFRPNPQEYLALMDIFALPSLSEGTSMTLLEAMSFGKPSIATAVGGTPEIIEQRQTGLLIANEDEDALVAAISALVDSPELRKQLGDNARHTYIQRFTLQAMTRRYEQLYEEVLA